MLHSRERASKRASEPSTNNCGAGPVIHKKGSIITVKIRLDFKTRKEHSRPFLATDKHSWFMINMRALLIWQIYCISCRISVEAFFFCISMWNTIYVQWGEPEGMVTGAPDRREFRSRHARAQPIWCPPAARLLCTLAWKTETHRFTQPLIYLLK